ncbi:hypothetical protein ABBQ38_002127 [Trebouxia sp. C0009 RCD-2024]
METTDRKEINVKEVFQEISENISRHGYRPQAPDMLAIRECILELAKWPALELTAGGLGGWLLGSALGRRVPAACIGMFICYGQVDRRPAEEFCLHQIMALPTPLGAEATAIVRGKDENSPHLRFLSELSAQSDRIAKSSSPDQQDWPQLAATAPDLQKQFPHKGAEAAATQDDPIWPTSDPFDLWTSDTADPRPSLAKTDPKPQVAERRRRRQEAYRAQRRQRHGELLGDLDHDDIFRESPR